MELIGIAGLAGSGKTSAAQWFGLERGAFLAAFADPIKQAVVNMFGLEYDIFVDRVAKETPLPDIGRSPRYLAQTLGTEWGRNLVHPDVWLLAMESRLKGFGVWGRRGATVVIHDMRFENEAKWIRKNNGVVLHVERLDRQQPVGLENHSSEFGLSHKPGDIVVKNNGTLEALGFALETAFPRTAA